MAARHGPVRRTRQPRVVRSRSRACRRGTSPTPRGRSACCSARRRRRQTDVRDQPGAGRAESRARGALFLRAASRQLRVRDRQPGSRVGARAGSRPVRCAGARRARPAKSPTSATPSTTTSSAIRSAKRSSHERFEPEDEDEANGTESFRSSSSSHPTACCRESRPTPTCSSARGLGLELGFDYVRGELRDTSEPLPRIPPFRFRGGLNYQRNAFQAGGEVVMAAKQDRVFGEETPTDGYNAAETVRLVLVRDRRRRPARSPPVSTMPPTSSTANHLSLIKDFVPEMGRNFKLVYAVRF